MAIGEYTFLVTDLLTGNVLDTVELGSFYWDEIFSIGLHQTKALVEAVLLVQCDLKNLIAIESYRNVGFSQI